MFVWEFRLKVFEDKGNVHGIVGEYKNTMNIKNILAKLSICVLKFSQWQTQWQRLISDKTHYNRIKLSWTQNNLHKRVIITFHDTLQVTPFIQRFKRLLNVLQITLHYEASVRVRHKRRKKNRIKFSKITTVISTNIEFRAGKIFYLITYCILDFMRSKTCFTKYF